MLDVVKTGVTWGVAMAVAVGVNHHRHEIGIVEGCCRALEGRIVEAPGRRPLLPEKPTDGTTMLLQSKSPALGVEVPLIPEHSALLGWDDTRRFQSVLHVIAAAGHQ